MKAFFLAVTFSMFALGAANAQEAKLRNNDTIEIRLAGVPAEEGATFNAPYPIDVNGMVNLPYIDQVKVAGLTASEAQVLIQKRLMEEKIYTHPNVTVTTNIPRLVTMLGEFKSPTRITYTPDMTLTAAIGASSGFTDFADKKHIRLTREGKTTIYNYYDIQKDPSTDPKLLPGDTVEVKQSSGLPFSG